MNRVKQAVVAGCIGALTICCSVVNSNALRLGDSQEGDGNLAVSFTPTKTTVKVNEDVRFKVKGNKKFYLYLFSVGNDGTGSLLLPNDQQKSQIFKENQEYTVPDKNGAAFVADKPGTEEVIMVASTIKLEIDRGKYKSFGQFMVAKDEDIQAEIKALKLRAQEEKAQQVVQTAKIVVAGKPSAERGAQPGAGSAADDVAPFVACNKAVFKDGEKMLISYGANKAGYVYLWIADESGVHFLKKEKVDGERFNTAEGIAASPFGAQKLVAVYNAKGDLDEKAVNFAGIVDSKSSPEAEAKGVTLTAKPQNFAVYQLDISK